MKQYAAAVLLALLVALPAGRAGMALAQGQTLIFNTEEWFPYNYARGNDVVGTSTELVKRMATKARIAHTITLSPWNRAYNNALTLPNHCVYSTNITDERKPLFKWVAPIENARWVIYKLKGSPIQAKTLEDLKGRVFGGYLGDAIAVYLKNMDFKVEEAASDHINPRKLLARRIDVWATYDASGLKLAEDSEVEVELLIPIRDNELGLACNKMVDDSAIAAMQKALADMNASGEADAIRKSRL